MTVASDIPYAPFEFTDDRVVFMDGGLIVEQGDPDQVLLAPREERTKRFLSLVL